MLITSRNNPIVKEIAALKEKKGRRAAGAYLIEGVKQVREAAAGGADILRVVRTEKYAGVCFVPEDKVVTVSESVFAKLSDEQAPQGVLAVLRIPPAECLPPQGDALLLDGVADPGNLGTILRTANAAGYADIYLRGCADPFAPKCVRAAMSGIFFVRLHGGEDEELFAALAGVPLVCADMAGEDVFSYTPPRRFCLVIGNEANGVTQTVRAMCADTVRIPMRDCCESLNAGVSAGVLMYVLASRKA